MKSLIRKNSKPAASRKLNFIQLWERTRTKGKTIYIFRFAIAMALSQTVTQTLVFYCIYGRMPQSLYLLISIIFFLFGAAWGGWLWHSNEKKYFGELTKKSQITS